jgi:metal-sulfur cluster biosynthetic enzyme
VNIVDLGLVYKCDITKLPTGGHRIDIDMTMTAPGCGMGEYLKSDVEEKLGQVPGVKAVDVEIVWEPVWDRDRMSEAATAPGCCDDLDMLWNMSTPSAMKR